MLQAYTVEQVRAAEAVLLAELPAGALMQRAAAGLGHHLVQFLGAGYGKRIRLLVGPGDNGGDALYAGALLARRGAFVDAVLLADQVHPDGLAAFVAAGGRTTSTGHEVDVVVDGIVGIGGRAGLRPNAVEALADCGDAPVVAVDLPSGLDADSGSSEGLPHVNAQLTVTFGALKGVHLVGPGAAACGAVQLVDIGLELAPAPLTALQAEDVRALVPRPAPDAHKYTRGVVGVRAGSPRYPGAGQLCVAGANTGLAGMVRYLGDPEVGREVVRQHPDVVVGDGRCQAIVVGSGSDADAADGVHEAVAAGVPLVLDADALAHLPQTGDLVLTPHAGELAGLLADWDRAAIEADPLGAARAAVAETGATVLLKGPRTVIAAVDGRVGVNLTGTPWLAVAGAGDVLAGLIGALLASGLTPFDAARVGAWLHGAAATRASAGGPVTAMRVASNLTPVLSDLAQRA